MVKRRKKVSKSRMAAWFGAQTKFPWLHITKGWKGDGVRLHKTNRRRRLSNV